MPSILHRSPWLPLLALWLCHCRASPPAPQYPPPDSPTETELRGDPNCQPHETDCNRCAPHVAAQVEALFAGEAAVSKHAWQAESGPYPPSGRTLHDATHRWWAVPRTHVQGFVRTTSPTYPFVLSYSHRERGSLLLLSYDEQRRGLELARILRLPDHHPSGLSALGQFVWVAGGRQLRVLDLEGSEPLATRSLRVKKRDPKKEGVRGAGGGLAAARLGPGRYLVLVATPGGGSGRPRHTRFYEVTGALPELEGERFLGEYIYENPPAWERSFAHSENVSLITECGSGALYALYTTGDPRLGGEGYARLSVVEGPASAPRLRHLAAYPMRQSSRRCHLRSAATLYVHPRDGTLRFLCHQRACRGWELELEFEIHTAR